MKRIYIRQWTSTGGSYLKVTVWLSPWKPRLELSFAVICYTWISGRTCILLAETGAMLTLMLPPTSYRETFQSIRFSCNREGLLFELMLIILCKMVCAFKRVTKRKFEWKQAKASRSFEQGISGPRGSKLVSQMLAWFLSAQVLLVSGMPSTVFHVLRETTMQELLGHLRDVWQNHDSFIGRWPLTFI